MRAQLGKKRRHGKAKAVYTEFIQSPDTVAKCLCWSCLLQRQCHILMDRLKAHIVDTEHVGLQKHDILSKQILLDYLKQ